MACLCAYSVIRFDDDLLIMAMRRCVKETIRSPAFGACPLGWAYTQERGASAHISFRSLAVI